MTFSSVSGLIFDATTVFARFNLPLPIGRPKINRLTHIVSLYARQVTIYGAQWINCVHRQWKWRRKWLTAIFFLQIWSQKLMSLHVEIIWIEPLHNLQKCRLNLSECSLQRKAVRLTSVANSQRDLCNIQVNMFTGSSWV